MTVSIGQTWKRRVIPAEDDGWSRVEVVGRFQQQEGDEFCLRKADGLGQTISASARDIEAAFTLELAAPADESPGLFDVGQAWL